MGLKQENTTSFFAVWDGNRKTQKSIPLFGIEPKNSKYFSQDLGQEQKVVKVFTTFSSSNNCDDDICPNN